MAANERLLTEITKFAFVVRLGSLLLLFATPNDMLDLPVVAAALFVLFTSTLGLYRNDATVRIVAAHPILVMLDVLVAGVIAVVVGPQSPVLFYSLSTALLIGLLLGRRFALPLITALTASYLLSVQIFELTADLTTWLVLPVMYGVLGALGRLTRNLYDTTLSEQAVGRQLAADAARERERARLAREMHDSVAKSLHGIALAAAALPAWVRRDTELAAHKAVEIQHAAETAAREARAVLVNLRSVEQDRPLIELLHQLVAQTRDRSGVDTTIAVSGIADCDYEIKEQLAAIVAEALENVCRHSGASTAHVECVGGDDDIAVIITDNGDGFNPEIHRPGHFGVIGMAERAQVIGGNFELQSAPGAGTVITAMVPRLQVGALS